MAEVVKFAKLKSYLESLPANTPDTPYEITVINYEQELLIKLTKVLFQAEKYVDLSSTVLDGIKHLKNGFCLKDTQDDYFSGCEYLVAAPKFVNCSATDATELFYECINLKSVDTTGFTNVTNANGMFCSCVDLPSIDTSGLVNVINAENMFYECTSLVSIDTSGFVNVKNALFMFTYCNKLTNIDLHPFKKLENANYMFDCCDSLKTVKMSNFENLTSIKSMFEHCNNLDEETKTAVDELSRKLS